METTPKKRRTQSRLPSDVSQLLQFLSQKNDASNLDDYAALIMDYMKTVEDVLVHFDIQTLQTRVKYRHEQQDEFFRHPWFTQLVLLFYPFERYRKLFSDGKIHPSNILIIRRLKAYREHLKEINFHDIPEAEHLRKNLITHSAKMIEGLKKPRFFWGTMQDEEGTVMVNEAHHLTQDEKILSSLNEFIARFSSDVNLNVFNNRVHAFMDHIKTLTKNKYVHMKDIDPMSVPRHLHSQLRRIGRQTQFDQQYLRLDKYVYYRLILIPLVNADELTITPQRAKQLLDYISHVENAREYMSMYLSAELELHKQKLLRHIHARPPNALLESQGGD